MYKHFEHSLIELKSFEIFFTVLSGVIIFIVSQFVLKLIIEPIVEYKRTIGRIDNKLKFYTNIITTSIFNGQNLPKNYLDVRELFRDLSCELETNYKVIPMKWLFIKLGFILQRGPITRACNGLIWIANSIGNKDETGTVNAPLLTSDKIAEIRRNLNIQSYEPI